MRFLIRCRKIKQEEVISNFYLMDNKINASFYQKNDELGSLNDEKLFLKR